MSRRCSVVSLFRRLLCGQPRIDFSLSIPTQKEPLVLEFKINNEQKIQVAIAPKTASGLPASVDGAPQWSVLSGDSTIAAAEDGMSAYLISSDTPGTTQIMVSADADLGEGVETIQDVITLHVESAKATQLGLMSVGVPEPKA